MPFADLHIHSTASDGTAPPALIPGQASQNPNLEAIALTDHDSLAGLEDAMRSCLDCMLEFVPGVEITTTFDGRPVHVLGYFIDPTSSSLESLLLSNRKRRARRVLDIADRMHTAGLRVSSQDLLREGAVANRPSLARLLVDRGYATSVDDAFTRFLCSTSPYYIDVKYPCSIGAIEIIHQAGGKAFIAHPARYGIVDLVAPLAREGADGLEAYHSLQTARQSQELVSLAHDLGIAISGGSDWHGDRARHATLGACGLEESDYRSFLQACERL